MRNENQKAKPRAKKQTEIRSNSVRINKYIAESGLASRRKADELIEQGLVKVNGKIVKDLGTIISYSDFVTVKGDPISVEQHYIYIVLNKPKDYITTTKDEKGRKTVLDLVKKRARIYPIGRLDRNTTGVLLLTNDGELAHRLTHPSYEIERLYYAKLDKAMNLEDAQKLSEGVELEDGMTAPCEVFVMPDDKSKVRILLKEGKNREVRRMFEAVGYEVKQLDRKMFAGITAQKLARGEYRHLERKELQFIKKLVKL